MPLHPKQALSLGLAALLMPVASLPGAEESPTDWEAILEEAEATAEWAADPMADLDLLGDEPLDLVYSASLSAGTGYSDNYLKSRDPDGSAYLKLEADAWISWFGKDTTATGMLFAEANSYIQEVDSPEEYLAFARADWTRQKGDFEFGPELDVFYGDQIYDASLLSNGGPKGENLRQFRPRAGLFADWYLSGRDRWRAGFSIQRVDYSFPEEDFWEPAIASEWERLWSKNLTGTTRVTVARQIYDDKKARAANGIDLKPAQILLVNRLEVEEALVFKPQKWQWLDLHLSFGLSFEEDRVGEYESQQEGWVSLSGRIKWDSGHVRLNTRWTDIRYRYRQVDYLDKRALNQNHGSLKLEWKQDLPWDLSLYLRGVWARFDSLSEEEEYEERRVEGLISWSY